MTDAAGLTELERDILAFEHGWWKHVGAKEQAITDRFGLTPTLYYQRLHSIIDKPEALLHDPMLVKRLRRLRDTRTAQRRRAR